MTQDVARSVAAFLIGFLGWLAVAAIRPVDPRLWVAPFALGLLAAAVAPRPLALVAVLLGVGVSYPAGLGLGLISYLGENFATYLSLFLSVVSAGFGAGLLAVFGLRSLRARSG